LPFQPLQLLLVIFGGWVNRHQLDVIEYLQEEIRVLKEHLGGRRIRLTDTERRRLARRAHTLGRKVLNELRTLVAPDTLLRWYREMIASQCGRSLTNIDSSFWTIRAWNVCIPPRTFVQPSAPLWRAALLSIIGYYYKSDIYV
jgi:hypothetical protein